MKVAISIVNYRTSELVINCLNSLLLEKKKFNSFKVFLVDNNSADNSIERFKSFIDEENCQDLVELIEAPKNGGFAYGNNLAIKAAFSEPEQPEYIYLLNPDTLMHENGIAHLVEFMDENQQAGIGGGGMVGADGQPQGAPRRFPGALSELESSARLGFLSRLLKNHLVPLDLRNEPFQCDWVSGASMIIRRKVIDSVCLMDERYFLYFEEVDYCFQAKKADFEVWYIPASVITHFEGASTEINTKKRRGKYWYDSRRRYFVKNMGVSHLLLADLLWGLGRLSYNTRRLIGLGANFENAKNDPTWFAWDLLGGDLNALLTGRIFKDTQRKLNND